MKPKESKKAEAHVAAPLVWGLTGGIASGKSTVARLFAEAGVPVIDADQIARELRALGGAAHEPIIKRFGSADPAKLREIVFSDPDARLDLERILHPLIREESAHQIAAAAAGHPGPIPIIYEATLLVEGGRYRDFHGLIVVCASEEIRLKRLMARDKNPEELGRKILRAQIQDEERRACATYVIENHGSLEDLRAQVMALVPKLS